MKKLEDARHESKKNEEDARLDAKKKEDEAREAERKRADEETARVRQTWTQMLPKVHENAEKYYMPLMGFALAASRTHTGERESGFFYYLCFLSRMKTMADTIGGFYLKTRTGEDMVGALWDAIRIRADVRFTLSVRQALQIAMATVPTLDRFQELPSTSIVAVQDESFAVETFSTDAILLRLFYLALRFETNLSYEFWYGEAEMFPRGDFEASVQELERSENASKYAALLQSLKVYITARSVQKTPAQA